MATSDWYTQAATYAEEVIEGTGGTAATEGTQVKEAIDPNAEADVKKETKIEVNQGTGSQEKSNRRVQKETRANELVNFLAQKEAELGRDLTQHEMSDWADGKGLWAYQSLNNKKGNWANAFGSRDFFGKLNNDTYTLLRKDLDAKKTQRKQADITNNRSDRVLQTITLNDGTTRDVTRGAQIMHQNFWRQGINQNDMTPEQATAFVNLLKTNGANIPETVKFEENTTLFNILQQLQPYVDDDELDVLGYYDDNDNLTVPHKETYEEMKARREKLEEDMKLKAQQKALDRQRARYGLADLAAGIGDIIKASGGAIVNPRDYQNMYNTLTAQQQTNYNNYLARMQALKEAERAKQQLADERAYQAQLLADKRKYDEGLLADERAYQAKLLADARLREDALRTQDKQHAKELLQIQHNNAIALEDKKQKGRLELVKERHKGRLDKFNNAMTIVFQNQDYTYNAASKDNVVSKLLGVVKKYFTDANGYSSVLANIESSQMSEYGKRYETGNTVIAAMEELYNDFSADDKNRIVEILKEYSVQNQDGAGGTTGGASTVKKKYQRTNADGSVTTKEMTDEEYNALDQSIRNLYTLVTE